jgi:hypothetical protein
MTVLEIKQAVIAGELDLREHEAERERLKQHIVTVQKLFRDCDQFQAADLSNEIQICIEAYIIGMAWDTEGGFLSCNDCGGILHYDEYWHENHGACIVCVASDIEDNVPMATVVSNYFIDRYTSFRFLEPKVVASRRERPPLPLDVTTDIEHKNEK